MLQHSYKQLEEAYQRGVNKDHKPNPAGMHPMSSQQGKGCQEMPITQTKPAQRGKHMDGWHSQPPSGWPHATPCKAEDQQHGPACAPGSTR